MGVFLNPTLSPTPGLLVNPTPLALHLFALSAENQLELRSDPRLFPFRTRAVPDAHQRELFIDNLLVRIHFINVMIRWTGLAPWAT